MYDEETFMDLVKAANRRFNIKRSSLINLYLVISPQSINPQADIEKIQSALRKIPNSKKKKYRKALEYLLLNHSEMGVKPRNFSWMMPGIGGMSRFDMNNDKNRAGLWLYKKGVRTVISIEKGIPPRGAAMTKKYTGSTYPKFEWHSCFLADWHAPSAEHLHKYCELVDRCRPQGAVVTHCAGGTGRTGCFLAAWSLYIGRTKSAEQAMKFVRENYNTSAVELKTQYNALARYSDHLGYPKSKTFDELNVADHARGHWHPIYGSQGLQHDPGHAGTNNGLPVRNGFRTMICSSSNMGVGAARSRAPYTSRSASSRVQKV